MVSLNDQPYTGGNPGRIDSSGVEWFACSPYPTWYRWEGDELIHLGDGDYASDYGEYGWEEHEKTLDPEYPEYLRLRQKFETSSNWHKKEYY